MATKVSFRGLNATVQQLAGGPINLKSIIVTNSAAAAAFLQIFDVLSGGVTLGTTVPVIEVEVGAGATVTVALPGDAALLFTTAISVAATTLEFGTVNAGATVIVTLGVA